MVNNWKKALNTSYKIWNEYLSDCDNSFNLQVFDFLLIHYFIFRQDEIAKQYNISIYENNKIASALKCFETFAHDLELKMLDYEVTDVNKSD